MKIQKNTISVALAVLTGLLVGFVFGAAYGSPDSSLETSGKSYGDVSRISRYRTQEKVEKSAESEMESSKDTVTLSAVDTAGKTWTIVMTSEKQK